MTDLFDIMGFGGVLVSLRVIRVTSRRETVFGGMRALSSSIPTNVTVLQNMKNNTQRYTSQDVMSDSAIVSAMAKHKSFTFRNVHVIY